MHTEIPKKFRTANNFISEVRTAYGLLLYVRSVPEVTFRQKTMSTVFRPNRYFQARSEYRIPFPIWGDLHGAAFVDAGNIWLLKKDPKRPGGELDRKTFLKNIALGTGIGLRYDIGMLVLRGDLGIGIHAPYDTGKKGYYNMTSFKNSLAFHLAIGYPF